LRFPKWIFYNTSYYENIFFTKALKLQLGFDFRFIDGYRSYSYYAPFSILYAGNDKNLPNNLVFDIFVNAQVKRMNFFLKFENVNKGFPRDYDYLLPHYPSDPRVFRFGFSWMFFD